MGRIARHRAAGDPTALSSCPQRQYRVATTVRAARGQDGAPALSACAVVLPPESTPPLPNALLEHLDTLERATVRRWETEGDKPAEGDERPSAAAAEFRREQSLAAHPMRTQGGEGHDGSGGGLPHGLVAPLCARACVAFIHRQIWASIARRAVMRSSAPTQRTAHETRGQERSPPVLFADADSDGTVEELVPRPIRPESSAGDAPEIAALDDTAHMARQQRPASGVPRASDRAGSVSGTRKDAVSEGGNHAGTAQRNATHAPETGSIVSETLAGRLGMCVWSADLGRYALHPVVDGRIENVARGGRS